MVGVPHVVESLLCTAMSETASASQRKAEAAGKGHSFQGCLGSQGWLYGVSSWQILLGLHFAQEAVKSTKVNCRGECHFYLVNDRK